MPKKFILIIAGCLSLNFLSAVKAESISPALPAQAIQPKQPAVEYCPCNGALSPCQVCVPDQPPPLPRGPLLLTSVRPEQLSADYWINRLPDPDSVLMTPEALKQFNEEIHMIIKDTKDIFKMETVKAGEPIRKQIELEYGTLKRRVLFDIYGQRIPQDLFEGDIRPLLETERIPERISLQWGAATQPASVRALPSDVVMLEEVGDIEFDQLQFTLIKLWTPVAIYHESSDGQWLYVQAAYARGWVKAKDIARFSSREQLKKFSQSEDFLAVTGESVKIYADQELKTVNQSASMGTVLPWAGENQKAYAVWMPVRGEDGGTLLEEAYVDAKSDVSVGFLPYTQRNIIRQAFKLLGARYGWGGTYQGRDCSGFTHDVFLSLGVEMPRTSQQQGFVGTQFSQFDPYHHEQAKLKFLKEATPGIALLRMPHHQMLYIGEENGQYYVIHSTWAERISMNSDEKIRINQVVVSDLNLNGKSYLGSLFDRIVSMNEID